MGDGHDWHAGQLVPAVRTDAPVLAIPGRRFYQKGFPALLRLAPDMNSFVAVGTAAAFGYSVVATFAPRLLPPGTVNVYYEAAAVIVALILLGRFLEARAKGRTSEAIKRPVNLQAKVAHVIRDGRTVDIPVNEVQSGDVVEVRPASVCRSMARWLKAAATSTNR